MERYHFDRELRALLLDAFGHIEVSIRNVWALHLSETEGGGPDAHLNRRLAIQQGCDLLEDRKEQYRRGGVPYFRPIMVLFSDGLPTSPRPEMEQANQRLVDMESDSRLTIFKVAVNAEAVQAMLRVLPNPNSRFQPQQLDNLRFSDFFVWLSRSVSAISRSTPGDAVKLPPADWTTIHV